MKVAPKGPKADNVTSGKEMVQWFFLDRIHAKRCNFTLGRAIEHPVLILSRQAVPAEASLDNAGFGAQQALNYLRLTLLIKHSLLQAAHLLR